MIIQKTLLAVLLLGILQGAVMPPPTIHVNRIVAVVNTNAITWLDLQTQVEKASKQMQAKKMALPPRPVLEQKILEQMVAEEVQLQYAKRTGLRIEDSEVDRAVEELAKQNRMDLSRLTAQLKKEGLTLDKLREDVQKTLSISRLQDREITAKVNVSEAEIDGVLSKMLSGPRTEYHLARMVIYVPEGAHPEEIALLSKKAESALAELKTGKPFSRVSSRYASTDRMLRASDIGWYSAVSLPVELVQLLEQPKINRHANIMRTRQGFLIFQLKAKRESSVPIMAQQYHVRHILIRINHSMPAKDAKARIEQARALIQSGAKFSDIAKLYSEDKSKINGGDLGWAKLSDLVQNFGNTMTTLPIGQVSQAVRTPFGLHLILVEGKRHQDISGELYREAIKQQIRSSKIKQLSVDWLSRLLEGAFIEARLGGG